MGHRSLQPTGLAAGCFYVHASDTSGPPHRHRRGQFSKLQLTLTAENCSEAHFTRTFYKIHTGTCTQLTSQWTETHRHLFTSTHVHTNTLWSLVEWQISPPRSNLTRNSNEIKCHQCDFSPFLLIVLGNGIRATDDQGHGAVKPQALSVSTKVM